MKVVSGQRNQAHQLLLKIARCPVAQHCLDNRDPSHPCAPIVRSQELQSKTDFQLPEPWSGDITHAPILFVSSNPSIGYDEPYPTANWTEADIADFFAHRFGGGKRCWVRDGRYPLLKSGEHASAPVKFWSAVRNRAREILDVPEVRPGIDYAITEVVHCKSRSEVGVREALDVCTERYVQQIIRVSGARVIVALGNIAASALRQMWKLRAGEQLCGPIQVGSLERLVIFLPHPNARQLRTVHACLTSQEIRTVRCFLGVANEEAEH